MKSTLILVSLVATVIASPVQLRQLHNDETLSLRSNSPEISGGRHMPALRQVIDETDDETGAVDFENDQDDDGLQDSVDNDDDNDSILDIIDPDDDNDGEPDSLDRRDNGFDLPDIPENVDLNPFDKH